MGDAIEEIRKNWGWFLASGILLLVLGFLALGSTTFTTLFTVSFLGMLCSIAGVVKVIYSFWARKWGGFFASFVTGLLYLVTGALILWRPAEAAAALTLLIAVLFIVSGVAKLLGSIIMRFAEWGWVFFSGLVSLLLGVLLLAEWPVSGLWAIGIFVGIDLIFLGWTWVILAFGAKRLPTR
jgi:uncharacterized membrane protein HdeD (DUF308 family)